MKAHPHAERVVCKITAAPKDVVKVFGQGLDLTNNGKLSTLEYQFEDNDLSLFLVYDYKATT